ncbi:MAG: hypothetical protein LIR46_02945 [Bacteroidota bacterium]|nr:hypothetical protein [Bacteroidota bacterium]
MTLLNIDIASLVFGFMIGSIIGLIVGVFIGFGKKMKPKKAKKNEWRKTDFHVGDVVQTVDGLDRGLVTDVNENNLPTKVMSSPGGVNYIEIRYYGGVDSVPWYKTGEHMTTKEWYELYSTKEGWQRYCKDRQNQIKLGK